MFSNHLTTNFSQNAAVKNSENRSIIGKDMEKTLWLTFLGHRVVAMLDCPKILCPLSNGMVTDDLG